MDIDPADEAVELAKCLITCVLKEDVDQVVVLLRQGGADLNLVVALTSLAAGLVKGFAIANDSDPEEVWTRCLTNIALADCA
jgi:hypothetical protein